MRNQTWTGVVVLLLMLGVEPALAETCYPESIPASTPDSQLQDNSDGTVTDTKTGLMWKQCVEGLSGPDCASGSAKTFTWQQALQQAQAVNSGSFAGFSDWRVPNIKELLSLVEHQCSSPAINLTRFPNASSAVLWSSSFDAGYPTYAWSVYFDNGDTCSYGKYYDFQLRLVRSAP